MSGIIARFETAEPVKFKEKGCDKEFAAYVEGALYLNDYDENAYGGTPDERRSNLAKLMVRKVEGQLSKWSDRDERLYREGSDVLEDLLAEDAASEGLSGRVRIIDIRIADDVNDIYQEQIVKPDNEARQEEFRRKLEEADEPHGPLISLSYNLSSHGMAAGTSSSSHMDINWKKDGSVIYTNSSSFDGKNFVREYKVTPETAQKARDYIAESKIPALAKLNLPTPLMYDNFTSATIVMRFDDSSIGGDPDTQCCLQCGAARMTYKTIEEEIRALMEECEKTGECIKNEMYDSSQGFLGLFGMGTPGSSGMTQPMNSPVTGGTAAPSSDAGSQTSCSKWTCKCGAENTGKYCSECGNSKPKEETWVCSCGSSNKSKFCSNCGSPKSVAGEAGTWTCPSCKTTGNRGNFCAMCGSVKVYSV